MVAKTVPLPNIRRLFHPDPGYIIFDVDLDRADAQVVAWEAEDEGLKDAFRSGIDIHSLNAETLQCSRSQAKQGVHATNYGASARTVATTLDISLKQAENFQSRWFEAHSGILRWHDRVNHALQTTRTVKNKFGYRRFYFDRTNNLLPEGLAWIPQSTVACVINRGFVNLDNNMSGVQVLLQVHDSLVAQCKIKDFVELLPEIKKNLLITIPYDAPLVIGVGIKASVKSWGDCQEIDWDGLPIDNEKHTTSVRGRNLEIHYKHRQNLPYINNLIIMDDIKEPQ